MSERQVRTGILLLNFGEPETATDETVIPFLERIFWTNAALDGDLPEAERRRRSRALAQRRAPGLIAEYRAIGGSPLNRQAAAQARALEDEVARRGRSARCYVGMQFTDPLIEHAARRAVEDGIERLIALPTYPLCGPSTTVAALESLRCALDGLGCAVEVREITGWHRHPLYVRLRADAIRSVLEQAKARAPDGRTVLVFSAHGTPLKYLEAGSRYEIYVNDCCRLVAAELGVADYIVGYQNHSNRGIPWTQPDIEDVMRGLDAGAVVVDAISFMHEQSETLAELDGELRELAEAAGLAFHRVPIPHNDPRFATVLAELAEPFLGGGPQDALDLRPCACRSVREACCLNRTLDAKPVPGA